jgi:hypothetical protein
MPHLHIISVDFDGIGDGELLYNEASRDSFDVDCAADEDATAVDMAVRYIDGEVPVAVEPDVIPGVPSWFSGRDDAEVGTEWYVGLEGFTTKERAEIGRRVYR